MQHLCIVYNNHNQQVKTSTDKEHCTEFCCKTVTILAPTCYILLSTGRLCIQRMWVPIKRDQYGMADSEHVLCDLLCFLKSKYGKVSAKPLKSSIMDLCKMEDIVAAKRQLINDAERLQLVQLPHIPDRRAGDDRVSRVMDDIFTVFACLDEQIMTQNLPCYVSKSPDCMPSSRLYEGDLAILMNLLTKVNGHIVENSSAIAVVVSDLCALCETMKSVSIVLTRVNVWSTTVTSARLIWGQWRPGIPLHQLFDQLRTIQMQRRYGLISRRNRWTGLRWRQWYHRRLYSEIVLLH